MLNGECALDVWSFQASTSIIIAQQLGGPSEKSPSAIGRVAMTNIQSFDQLRAALQSSPFHEIVRAAEPFLRQAAEEDNLNVKQLLREIVSRQTEGTQSEVDVRFALIWLSLYRDPELVVFYMDYLDDPSYRYEVLCALIDFCHLGILTSDDRWVSERIIELMKNSDPLEWEMMVALLWAMHAVNALEFLLAQWYVRHPDMRVRRVLAEGLIFLIKDSGRTDLFDLMASMLEDESSLVRHEAMVHLVVCFPDRFPDIDLKKAFSSD